MNFVKAYNKGDVVTLNDVAEIKVSPTYKKIFSRILNSVLEIEFFINA